MTYAAAILQVLDRIFTEFIFVPMIFILYARFTAHKQRSQRFRSLYRFCMVLVILFLLRWFCATFIFTEVNYLRFTDNGFFPLIKAIFYPDYR